MRWIMAHLSILARSILWLPLLKNTFSKLSLLRWSSSPPQSSTNWPSLFLSWGVRTTNIHNFSPPPNLGAQFCHYLHHVGVVFLGRGVPHHNSLLITPLRLVVLVVAAQKCLHIENRYVIGRGLKARVKSLGWYIASFLDPIGKIGNLEPFAKIDGNKNLALIYPVESKMISYFDDIQRFKKGIGMVCISLWWLLQFYIWAWGWFRLNLWLYENRMKMKRIWWKRG